MSGRGTAFRQTTRVRLQRRHDVAKLLRGAVRRPRIFARGTGTPRALQAASVSSTRSAQSSQFGTDSGAAVRERRPHILVVDDGAEARELYCAYLEYHGFRADAAEDGAAGLAKARATQPDAIVLDYSMPRMDGEQVLVLLQADERTRDIPVLMLTAVPELVSSGVRAECMALLEKPCEPDRLVSAVEAMVRDRRKRR
jgi:CheY-like chemotaxis protein